MKRRHLLALLCLAALLRVIAWQVTPLIGAPLPGSCTFKKTTGIDCPGCDLTRCFVSLGHGRVSQAWGFNPAGIVLYAAVIFQIPYRISQLRRLRRGQASIDLGWTGPGFLFFIAFLLILQWAVRMWAI